MRDIRKINFTNLSFSHCFFWLTTFLQSPPLHLLRSSLMIATLLLPLLLSLSLYMHELLWIVRTDLASPHDFFDPALFRQPSLAEGQLKPKPYRKVRSLSDPFRDLGIQDSGTGEEKNQIHVDLCRDSGSSDSCDYPDIEGAESSSHFKGSGSGSGSGSRRTDELSVCPGRCVIKKINISSGKNEKTSMGYSNGNDNDNRNEKGNGKGNGKGEKHIDKNANANMITNAIHQDAQGNIDPHSNICGVRGAFAPVSNIPKLGPKKNMDVSYIDFEKEVNFEIENMSEKKSNEKKSGNEDDEKDNMNDIDSNDEIHYYYNDRGYSPARCRSRSNSNGEDDDSENERDVNEILECNAPLDGDGNDRCDDYNDNDNGMKNNRLRDKVSDKGMGKNRDKDKDKDKDKDRERARERDKDRRDIYNNSNSSGTNNNDIIIDLFPFKYGNLNRVDNNSN